jgi:hypothetical protein
MQGYVYYRYFSARISFFFISYQYSTGTGTGTMYLFDGDTFKWKELDYMLEELNRKVQDTRPAQFIYVILNKIYRKTLPDFSYLSLNCNDIHASF